MSGRVASEMETAGRPIGTARRASGAGCGGS